MSFDSGCMRHITSPLAGCLLAASVLAGRHYFPEYFQVIARFESALLFLAGLIAGIRLPDIDLALPGFSHRSGITHSCLLAVLPLMFNLPFIAGGLALGIALHLSSDIQPKSWSGGALIKFPILGSIGMFSPLWILLNIVGCFVVLFHTLPQEHETGRWAILAVMLTGGGWYFLNEEKKRLFPLMTLAFSLLLVHQYRSGQLSVEIVIQYFA
ncbi:hypothetical protein [Endozoicomonas numazuensis]|uniref:Hydrolase n=1 Tax=Endozoicomonas numazuensis TaxID=1137799 RepID=A0A081NM89_9GAMM|nr:hypothetical protein [Endozoicomonas numazuensis]KEQ19562.1 hypothetical protein GZ78_06555 [Endozoicomonas numazuensis]